MVSPALHRAALSRPPWATIYPEGGLLPLFGRDDIDRPMLGSGNPGLVAVAVARQHLRFEERENRQPALHTERRRHHGELCLEILHVSLFNIRNELIGNSTARRRQSTIRSWS